MSISEVTQLIKKWDFATQDSLTQHLMMEAMKKNTQFKKDNMTLLIVYLHQHLTHIK